MVKMIGQYAADLSDRPWLRHHDMVTIDVVNLDISRDGGPPRMSDVIGSFLTCRLKI